MPRRTQETNANKILVQKMARRDNLVKSRRWENNINLLVTRCINKFNIQQLYALPILYLCVA
jgi:hypothetical protein